MTDASEERTALPTFVRLAFGVGAVGEIVYLGMFNTFIGIYYNQAVGLSNSLIGAAILLALIGDAISDPAIGIISDRWQSRWGRRHPFLFFAPLPLACSLWFIFNPPAAMTDPAVLQETSGQMALFAWLASWTIASRLFLTSYVIPHLALGGELTNDPLERSRLFSANAMFGYASGALLAFIAWSVFLSGETVNAAGTTVPRHLEAQAYGPLTFFAASVILICISACAAGTFSRVSHLSAPPADPERLSLFSFVRKILGTLRNRNYAFLLLGFFFFMISSGLYETFSVFVQTYFWELTPEDIRFFGLAALPGAVLGALVAPRLMDRFDRKPVLLGGLVGLTIFSQLVIDLRLLGWLPENGHPIILPLLLVNACLFAGSLGLCGVAILSMLADVVDENELVTGVREEGLFYSARAFFAKLSGSVGHFVAGLTLDWFVRLPFEAVPGQVDPDVITRLGIAAGPTMAIAAAIAIPFYWQYSLTRERHQEIVQQLASHRFEGRGTASGGAQEERLPDAVSAPS